MSRFDKMYLNTCNKILTKGVKTQARNGITYRIPGEHWIFNLKKEFPILTCKQVAWKFATLEMFSIYKAQTNQIAWLRERGIRIWDKFEISQDGYYRNPDTGEEKFYGVDLAGTYGTSYAYIIKYGGEDGIDQTTAALNKIVNYPSDRRIIICMWQPPFFKRAVLPPCVYKVQFLVLNGELHSYVEQRSCDTFIGLPFNITQYAMLTYLFAHVTNLKPGKMHYNMVDVHIYEEHIEVVQEMLKRKDDVLPAPKLWINPEVKDFFEFDDSKELKDIKLEGYQHLGGLKGIVKA